MSSNRQTGNGQATKELGHNLQEPGHALEPRIHDDLFGVKKLLQLLA
jgi:hypothetical protein